MPERLTLRPGSRRSHTQRGSALLVALILITIAAIMLMSWMSLVMSASRSAARDRDYLEAFYAAEAGVEQVVAFFNNADRFPTALVPGTYTTQMAEQPAAYALTHDLHPDPYLLFEPYIVNYVRDSDNLPINASGEPIWDPNTNSLVSASSVTSLDPVITMWTYFQNINAGSNEAVSKTSKVPTMDLDMSYFPELIFRGPGGDEVARVSRIQLIHPADADSMSEGPLPDERVITKVIAHGLTPTGVEVRVESILTENLFLNLRSPAAIITTAAAQFNGQFNVHWGELWAQHDVTMPGSWKNMVPRLSDTEDYNSAKGVDKWFRFRTSGEIYDNQASYADGRDKSGFSSAVPYETGNSGDPMYDLYTNPYHENYIIDKTLAGLETIRRHQDLDFPGYDYDHVKRFFLQNDMPYYWTDSSGTIYWKDRETGVVMSDRYSTLFGVDPSDPEYGDFRENVVFIDSVPVDDSGNPHPTNPTVINDTYYPRNPHTSIALIPEIAESGSSLHTRGAFFVAVDMDFGGGGSPPSSSTILDDDGSQYVTLPDGSSVKSSDHFPVFHNGLMYSWGVLAVSGNRNFFGSVFAEQGYGAGGNPDVYYNYRMRDGSWLQLNVSKVNRTLWDVSQSTNS
ncbi:MAG: pilus assembly PilX N-terminal domain-containing protein [Sumerlaeia bacterium]